MAHYLSDVTHARLADETRLMMLDDEDEEEYTKAQPTSYEFEGYIRAMEVSSVFGPDMAKNSVDVWTADQEGTISVRNIESDVSHVIPRKPECHVSALLAHGPLMWVGLSDGYLRVFDQKKLELIFERKQHSGRITCMVSVGPDVYTGSDDWQIYKWSSKTFEPTLQLSGHQCSVLCLAHDGNDALFSGSEDFTIRCWDLENKKERLGQGWPARNHSDGVTAIVICEVHLFSASRDGTIKVWNTQTGQMLKYLDRREGAITSLMKDPTSMRIWAGDTTGTISVYDALSLNLVTRMRDHADTYVKHLGLLVRLSSLKVWSLNGDGIVKVWYADEDNEYSVYQPRCDQLQDVVEDKRAQLIENFNQIEACKETHKMLTDRDNRRKANLAVEMGRKSRLATEAAYYNRVIQWIMKRREEAKCRQVSASLNQLTDLITVRTAYHRFEQYAHEQTELRRKVNMSRMLLEHTQHKLSTAYWRNLLTYVRQTKAHAQKAATSAALGLRAEASVMGVYYLRWTRFVTRQKERHNRPKIAQTLKNNMERQTVSIFYKKIVDFADREKDNEQKRRTAGALTERNETSLRIRFYHKLQRWAKMGEEKRLSGNRGDMLANANSLRLMRSFYDLLLVNARSNSASALASELKLARQKNEDLEKLLSMQASYTDEQIDMELAQLERELQGILDETVATNAATTQTLKQQTEVRRTLSRTVVTINREAVPADQLAEVMLLLKGKSVSCGNDFDHLTEARDDGKKIGPSKLYEEGVKKVKKICISEAQRRGKELGCQVPSETVNEDGEWLMMDSVDAYLKKSIRGAASGIKDMIIGYDMMTINPAALNKVAHNVEVIANAGTLLDIVMRYFGMRKKSGAGDGRGSSKKKSSKKKSSKKKKKSVKKTDEDGVVKTSKKSSKKKSSKKKKATGGPSMLSRKKKSSKKSTKKKSSKKKSTKKKSSKKSTLKKKSSKKSTKKKSTKKKSTKKKSTKKKSTKKRTLKKKKSTKKRTLKKKKTGKKKRTVKKPKIVRKPATSAMAGLARKKEVDPAKKPWLGMMIQVEMSDKVIVHNVAVGGPAALAGFGDNDVLINFGGAVITDVASFQAAFKLHAKAGAKIAVRALHNGDISQPFEAELAVGSFADKKNLDNQWGAGADTLEDAEKRAEAQEHHDDAPPTPPADQE